MHELPVINNIVDIVSKHAVLNNVTKIKKIYLKVGELSDLENKWMQHYFDYVAKNTLAEGAELAIERIRVRMKCDACGAEFEPDMKKEERVQCPDCRSETMTLIAGKEYFIANMEVI